MFPALFVLSCSDRDHVFTEERPLGFSGDIKHIMAQFCFECHGVKNTESGLDLRTIESMLKGGEGGPNTGGGGGGGGQIIVNSRGGHGGSGIAIIRYII